nr:hypothetical protein [Victivallales bacterium]
YSPSLALAMLDALPYMCEYPHGCTEQTLNKFVPLVIVNKVLKDMGLNLEDISKKTINFDSQQTGSGGASFSRTPRGNYAPVFDKKLFDEMVGGGLKRLENMQLSDGGWGWFSGYGEHSYPHTTAVVVHGLATAKLSGINANQNVIARGLEWLRDYQRGELERLCKHQFDSGEGCNEKHPDNYKARADETDALVYMVLAEGGIVETEMTRILYRDRNHLKVYGKALFALGLFINGEMEKMEMLKRNISQYLILDDENQTAYLNLGEGNLWWCWHGSEIEANAFYLKLLAVTEPKSEISPKLVKYLLNNRKNASYWNSTRDTAYCIEAMAEFIKASGEDKPDMNLGIIFDGKPLRNQKINSDNLFLFDNAIALKGAELGTGNHKIEFRKDGKGPLYYSGYLTYFTLEDFIEKAGLEIKVERRYYKLVGAEKQRSAQDRRGQVVKQNVEKFERIPIKNYDVLKSGDLIEVELVVESKNDYEYLVFEDMKPAGLETCEVRSGYSDNEMNAFVEYRDERVLFYVRSLPRGMHSVSYRMKAEIPGTFSVLPTKGSAMYAPELKANSDEIKISVED